MDIEGSACPCSWIRRGDRTQRRAAEESHLDVVRARIRATLVTLPQPSVAMMTLMTSRMIGSLATSSREVCTAMANKSARAFRLTKIQMRRSRRSLRKQAHRARVAAIMRLFRAQQTGERIGRRTFMHANRWSATLVSVLLAGVFVAFAGASSTLKASEVSLTC